MQTEPRVTDPTNDPLPAYLKGLVGILVVMFPVGFIIMFTEFGSEYLWTTTIFLGLQALITFLILLRLADTISVIIVTTLIFISSFSIEWWGVNSGFPFGLYSYTGVLQPLINGVPLAISFAWFVVSANSFLAAKYFLGSGGAAAAAVSSVLILATDILLEPFASFVNNFWIWNTSAIPIQNFISWFIIGLAYSLMMLLLINWKKDLPALTGSKIGKIPVLIVTLNILNFSVINFVNGYYLLTAAGLIIITTIIAASVKFSGKTTSVKPV